MPSSTDSIQRQHKLEEFGVKYICTAEEGGISLQRDTVLVTVVVNGPPVVCTITCCHPLMTWYMWGFCVWWYILLYCGTVLWYLYFISRCCFQRMHTLQLVYIISHSTSYTSVSLLILRDIVIHTIFKMSSFALAASSLPWQHYHQTHHYCEDRKTIYNSFQFCYVYIIYWYTIL